MKKRQLCQQAAVVALTLLLLGCSSAVSINYFQLPQPAISTAVPAANAAVLVVEPVMVASYLNTNALILQTSILRARNAKPIAAVVNHAPP